MQSNQSVSIYALVQDVKTWMEIMIMMKNLKNRVLKMTIMNVEQIVVSTHQEKVTLKKSDKRRILKKNSKGFVLARTLTSKLYFVSQTKCY